MRRFPPKYLVPNAVTFAHLACGVISILIISTGGNLKTAGIFILAAYILDMVDGSIARKIDASSEFGLQMDSLADMVGLGVAPAALVFAHLQGKGLSMAWVWPIVILLPLSGAFRLARFNLLPMKTSASKDSVGLTISTGGAVVAMAVLSDLYAPALYLYR